MLRGCFAGQGGGGRGGPSYWLTSRWPGVLGISSAWTGAVPYSTAQAARAGTTAQFSALRNIRTSSMSLRAFY